MKSLGCCVKALSELQAPERVWPLQGRKERMLWVPEEGLSRADISLLWRRP